MISIGMPADRSCATTVGGPVSLRSDDSARTAGCGMPSAEIVAGSQSWAAARLGGKTLEGIHRDHRIATAEREDGLCDRTADGNKPLNLTLSCRGARPGQLGTKAVP